VLVIAKMIYERSNYIEIRRIIKVENIYIVIK